MRSFSGAAAVAALAATGHVASLDDVCTVSNVQSALPSNGTLFGLELIPSTVTAAAVYYNVTVSYTHTGKGDSIELLIAFPEPADFAGRFYVVGGGGYSISSSATGGLEYGAVGAATSAGYDALDGVAYDDVVLYGNGSNKWDATRMFGYEASRCIHIKSDQSKRIVRVLSSVFFVL